MNCEIMNNTYFILSNKRINIERLHICTWDFIGSDAAFEIGFEFIPAPNSPNNIIKDVSYAIEKCFDKGENYELKERIFGYTTKKDSGTVKNLTFVYNIYVYILYCLPDEELLRR